MNFHRGGLFFDKNLPPPFLDPLCRIAQHSVGVWIDDVWNDHFPESEEYLSWVQFFRNP